MEKIVLFGGTFDPVHNAHLRIARFASLKLNADVVFIPAKNPRWKQPKANITDRYNMLRIALKKEGTGSVYISDYEIKSNDKINYAIDTIKYFKKKFKNREICLLIGADQVASFHDWKDANEIARLAKIIYVSRPDVTLSNENINKFHMESLVYSGSGSISSSDIRSLKQLDTPLEVLNYIEKNELYYIKTLKERYYSSKRLAHAISVARLAYEIATNNHREEASVCYIAGLLHDIGKKIPESRAREIMEKEFKKYVAMVPPILYHQFVGAYIARTEFNITDERIIDAIMYHATGKAHMTPIGKIVYAADKIDPLRDYNSSHLIKACMNNYYAGFQMVLKANRDFLIKNNHDANNKLTKECLDLYLFD